MPLDKSGSKSSVKKNIVTEMKVGVPPKQALAIALSTKKTASKPMPYKPTMKEELSEGMTKQEARKVVSGKMKDEPDMMKGSALSMNARKKKMI